MITRPEPLRDQAYQLIRDQIIRQELKFGSKLSIAELSREFGISNSPIREAISLLITEGLVESVPNQGFYILHLDSFTFSEIAQSIYVLLSGCYDSIVYNGKTGRLASLLKKKLKAQEDYPNPGPVYDYACCTIDFDRSFVEVCGSRMLSRMFEAKFNLLVLCTLQIYSDDRELAENLHQHRQILEAVLAEDDQRVRRLLAEHYEKKQPEGCTL